MERKVGETFEFKGRTLEVVEQEESCIGCYFLNLFYFGKGRDMNKMVGRCGNREDKKNVIFKEVN